MVDKYGFQFPQRFLGIVGIAELKVNRRMTESESLKKVITTFIDSKKWVYRLVIAAIVILLLPYAFKFLIS